MLRNFMQNQYLKKSFYRDLEICLVATLSLQRNLTLFVIPAAGNVPIILILNLNDSEFTVSSFGLFL